MRLHHLAIFSPDPCALATFYRSVLGLSEGKEHRDEAGIRSVWLELHHQVILMVERGVKGQNGVVVFAVDPGTGPAWADRLAAWDDGSTEFTRYARDPDGNRFGVSSFPHPLDGVA